ncbi:MAG: hypothetical protein JW866_06190 [Ignavibacteriales bacterium]|nr:hypothetical protein [Ignavibacteriales bacterium]
MIIDLIVNALRNITVGRYYRTERGYVSEFYRLLYYAIEQNQIFPKNTILESEVQKRALDHYGVTQRPDLLIHIPIETGLTDNANENNFVCFAFKLNGNFRKVNNDFEKLEQMFQYLNYELGVLINIGSYPQIYLDRYLGNYKNRIHEFSVGLADRNVEIRHAFFNGNEFVIEEI